MSGRHWAILGACLVSIAGFGAGVETWGEVFAPRFVFPALGAIGSTLAGIYSQKPGLHQKWPTDWPSPPPSGPKYGKRVG